MYKNSLYKLLLFVLWTLVYLQLNTAWKFGVLLLLLINLYYQQQYKKTNKLIHKKAAKLTLGMAIHCTLLGWTLLIGRGYK